MVLHYAGRSGSLHRQLKPGIPNDSPESTKQTGAGVGPDWFAVIAAGYLVLPSLIFLFTWVRCAIGIPVVLVVLAAYAVFIKQCGGQTLRPKLSAGTWIFILSLGFLMTLAAGIGGLVPQTSDYEKHNLLFHDLTVQPWPVYYSSGTNTTFLCYGLGYYLPPMIVARSVGDDCLPMATIMWAFLGVVLFFYWLATLTASPKRTISIVVFFATTETFWHWFLGLLKTSFFGQTGQVIGLDLIHLGLFPDYSDTYSALQWRPQHVIPAWLGTALFYDLFWIRRSACGAGLVWAACWMWSPITCLGLLLLPLVGLKRWRWQDALEPVNLGAAILLAVLGVYIHAHVALTEKGPLWQFSSDNNWLLLYPWLLLLQLGPIFLIFLIDVKYNLLGGLRPLFRVSFILLALLPLYKLGYYGDQRLQCQTPALLVCGLAACRIFLHAEFNLRRPLCALLAASQLFGLAYPVASWWRKALTIERHDYSYDAVRLNWGCNNLSEYRHPGYDYSMQYLGQTNSLAARWLLRPSQ
jgi:hypothetical protein